MKAILAEKQPSREDQERLELQESVPEKYEQERLSKEDLFPKPKKFKKTYYKEYTQKEIQDLLEASAAPVVQQKSPVSDHYYQTFSEEEVQDLLRDYFNRPERKK